MPKGVWSKKDERQYKAVLKSCVARGRSTTNCKRMAAAVVSKMRSSEGRTKTVGCHCPNGTRPLKNDRLRCYNPRTRKRVMRVPPRGRKRCSP